MFDTKKIDSFFSGEKNLLEEEEKIYISRRTKIVRFFKLFLPCLTALLLGLGVILFDFEADSDSTLSLAEEDKIYFEKFRMKNTVFEITEKDNQYSTLKAQVVEETEPNTKIYNLTLPTAETLDKGKIITISAQKGVYNQTTQKLDLKGDINVDYNHELEITTPSASYNFSKETGYGHEQIIGKGDGRYFKADEFTVNKKNGILTLIHHVFIQNNDMELRSPDKAILFVNENKFTSTNVQIKRGESTLKADKLVVYFKDTKNFEISRAYANGNVEIQNSGRKAFADSSEYVASKDQIKLLKNVRIVDTGGYMASGDVGIFDNKKNNFILKNNVIITDKSGYKATAEHGIYDLNEKTFTLDGGIRIVKEDSVITAPKAIYFQDKEEFRFYKHIRVSQADGTVEAKSGVYYVKKNFAELEDNVIITKNGNQVRGDKAISDFTTSKSRLLASKGKRVFGKLFENSFKKNSKDK